MKRTVYIRVEHVADGTHVDRLRNFGEDLFRMFRSADEAVVDIDAVDRATDQIAVTMHRKSQHRRVLRKIEVHAARAFPDGIASVWVEDAKE
jgi:hypothetical protein